jgi:hypothetical protein
MVRLWSRLPCVILHAGRQHLYAAFVLSFPTSTSLCVRMCALLLNCPRCASSHFVDGDHPFLALGLCVSNLSCMCVFPHSRLVVSPCVGCPCPCRGALRGRWRTIEVLLPCVPRCVFRNPCCGFGVWWRFDWGISASTSSSPLFDLFDHPFPCRFGMNRLHFIKPSVKGPKIGVIFGSP